MWLLKVLERVFDFYIGNEEFIVINSEVNKKLNGDNKANPKGMASILNIETQNAKHQSMKEEKKKTKTLVLY
jgi:hypothetical protein